MDYTRRNIGKLALGALTTGGLLAKPNFKFADAPTKPNSRFAGVYIGINAPITFHGTASTADEIIAGMTRLGLSACELRMQPVEGFIRGTGASPVSGDGVRGGGGRAPLTPEMEAAQKAGAENLRKWRLSLSTDVFKAFRKKYNDAGILISVLKVDNIDTFADDVVDYSFNVAKLLGAKSISTEIPLSASKRIGQFADKHKMLVGYHGHTNLSDPEAFGSPQSWETAMSYAKYNGWNLDIGHFVAANSISPVPFLQKYHDRITHLHLKDRKNSMGPNVPWGQGDTPVVECLHLIRDKKWNIPGIIEMEHPIPQGSDNWIELGKCIDFCKKALL